MRRAKQCGREDTARSEISRSGNQYFRITPSTTDRHERRTHICILAARAATEESRIDRRKIGSRSAKRSRSRNELRLTLNDVGIEHTEYDAIIRANTILIARSREKKRHTELTTSNIDIAGNHQIATITALTDISW